MASKYLGLTAPKTSIGLHRLRKVTTNLALGTLATALIAAAAIPAFAGKPERARQASAQSHELTAANKKGGKAKTATKTFANDATIAVPAEDAANAFGPASLYPSPLTVSGFKKGKVTDVNLTLRGFSHQFPRDTDVLLVAPNGRAAVVLSDAGLPNSANPAVEGLTLRLDDEATASLADNGILENGTFRPFNVAADDAFPDAPPVASKNISLSTFDGLNPNGQWRLFVFDDGAGGTGAIDGGWELEITAKKAKNKGKKKH